MEKLQRTTKGKYFILLPSEMIKLTEWKEGNEIDVRSGIDITPKKGDLILRKVL